jgi:hypothetical protein
MKQRKVTDIEIIESYNKHKHLGRISADLKLPFIQVWRLCKKLNLPFGNGGGTKIKLSLQEILDGLHPYYQTGKLKKRLLKEGIMKNECASCSIINWNNKNINMQLDHINGDSSDHRLNNLQLLCPNCHSQTDTWCGKNIGR